MSAANGHTATLTAAELLALIKEPSRMTPRYWCLLDELLDEGGNSQRHRLARQLLDALRRDNDGDSPAEDGQPPEFEDDDEMAPAPAGYTPPEDYPAGVIVWRNRRPMWATEDGTIIEVPAAELTDYQQNYMYRHDQARGCTLEECPRLEAQADSLPVNNKVIARLALRNDIYCRGGQIVSIRPADEAPAAIRRPAGSTTIALITAARLRELLADSVRFSREKVVKRDDGTKAAVQTTAGQPKWMATQIMDRGQWPGMQRLEGIVRCPQLLADGTLLSEPGYDAASGLYLDLRCELPEIPAEPTQRDAHRAACRLLGLARDFPFAEEASRSAWLATTLTPHCRYAVDGPVPMTVIDSNCRGVGKGLLVNAAGIICTGGELPVTSAGSDNAEMEKRITSILLAGDSMVVLDNVTVLGGDAIDALLTARTWRQRILGKSEMTAELPATALWIATGNNIGYEGDVVRRVLHCRLETRLEQPEERPADEFQHADLLAWVREHRGQLIAAAITMLRAYHLAGRPDMGLTPWGSFEAWSALVRGCIVWAGLADPAGNRRQLREEADKDVIFLAGFLDALEIAGGKHGLTMQQIIEYAEADVSRPGSGKLKAVLAEMAGPSGKLTSRSVGNRLGRLRKRVVGGRFLDHVKLHGSNVWRAVRADATQPGQ